MRRSSLQTHKGLFLLMAVAAALLMVSWQAFAQETTIAKKPETTTPHTEQMRQILEQSKWGAGDRTMEALYDVDQHLMMVRKKIKGMRAMLFTDASKATEEQLEHYVKAAETMVAMKKALSSIQANMASCMAQCSRVEMAAAEGKHVELKDAENYADKGAMAVKEFRGSLDQLKSIGEKLDNVKMKNLAAELSRDADALEKAVGLCKVCMKAPEEPTKMEKKEKQM